VRRAIGGQQLDAPQGFVKVDPATQHVIQTARVGKLDASGTPIEVYQSPQPIVPQPFPKTRERGQWESLVKSLHARWGGRWSNPGSERP
jgi:hypothetical protein